MKKILIIIFLFITLNCYSQEDIDSIKIQNKVFIQNLPKYLNFAGETIIKTYFFFQSFYIIKKL